MNPINTIRQLENLTNYNYTALPDTDFTPTEVTNWLNTVLDLLENNFEKPEIFTFTYKFSAKLISSIHCVKKFNTLTISNLADKCLATIAKLNSIVQKRMDFDPKWFYDYILLVHSPKITPCDSLPDKECFKKDGNAIFITLKPDNIILSILDDRNKVRRIQLSIAQACNPSEIPHIRSRLEQALEEIKLRQYVRIIEPAFYIHIIIEPSRSIFNHPYVWHVKIVNGKVIPVSPGILFPQQEYTVKEFLDFYKTNYAERKINNLKELVKKHLQCNSEPKVTPISPAFYQIQSEHNLINATLAHLFCTNIATIDSMKRFTNWLHERIANRFRELPWYKPGQTVSPEDFSSERICVLTISSEVDEPIEITLHTKNKQGEMQSEVLYSNGSFIDDAFNKFTLLKSIQVVQKEFPHIPISHGIDPEEGEVKVGYDKYCPKVWYRSVTGNIVSQRIYYANPSDAENMPINATISENEIRTACGCIQTQSLIKDLNKQLQENWFYEDPVCLNETYLKTFDPQKRGDNDPLVRLQYDYTQRKTARKKHTLGISYEPEKEYAIHKEGNSFPLPTPQKQYPLDLLQGSQIWSQLRTIYGTENIYTGSEMLWPNKFLCIVKIDEVEIHFYDSHKNRNSITFSHDSLPKIEGLELFLRRVEFLRNYLNQPGAIQFVQRTPNDKHLQGLVVQPYGETIKIIYAIPGTHHFHTAECDLDTFIEILQITDQKYRAELHAYHSVLIQKYGKERLNTTGKPIFKHTATLLPHTRSLKLNYLDYRGAEKTHECVCLGILDRDRIDTIDKFTQYMVEFIATPAGCDFCNHHDISMKYIKVNLSLIRVEKKYGPSHANESRHPLDAIDKILPEKLKEFIELRDEVAFAVITKFGVDKVGPKPDAVLPGKYTVTPTLDGFDIHYIDYRNKQTSQSFNLDTPNEKIDRFIQIHTILSHFNLFPLETLQPSLDPNEGRIGFSYNFDLTVIKIRYYDFHLKEFFQIESSVYQLETNMQCIMDQGRGFPGYLRDKYKTEHVITEGKFTLDPDMYGLKVKKGKVECHFLDPKGENRVVSFNINELPEKEKLDAILKCSLVLNSYSTQPNSIPFSYFEELAPWCIDIRERLVEGIFVRSTADYSQLDIQYIDPTTNKAVHHIVDPEHFVETLKQVQDTYLMLLAFLELDTSPEIRAKTFVQASVPPFQAGHPPDCLETLFKEINFEDEKHPCYMNPRATTEYGNVVPSYVLYEQLQKFIRIVTDGGDLSVENGHYFGISDDPAQKLKYYTELRAYLSNIIMKLKEPSVPIDRKNDIVVSFAIAGRHCGGRWMGECIQHYNELFKQNGETIEAIILSMVDRFKISIIEEMDNKERQPNVHKYLAICRALKQHGLGIPAAAGAEYDHFGENALIGSSFPDAEAVRKGFMDRFTVPNVVAWIHEQANHEIKAKNTKFNGLLQEKMYNMVHDRMHANEPEKIAQIERKFHNMEEEQAKAERRSAIRALIETEVCDTCLIYNEAAELVKVTRKGIMDLMIYTGVLVKC